MADNIFCSYSDGIMFCNHVLRDVSENAMYGPHSHNVYEMIYVKSGVARYGVQGKEYPIGEGDLLITKPYEEHYLYPDAGVRYERYDVLFDENALGFSFSDKLSGELPPISLSGNRAMRRLFEKFDFYYENLSGEGLQVIFNGLVREICVNVLLMLTESALPRITENKTVLEALEYIDENLTSITAVEDVSSALFISKSHLQHLFSKHLGKSPKRYMTEKRLLLAKREIAQGARSTEVYAKYGFSEYSSFFRAYKKAFGIPPSAGITAVRTSVTPENTIVRATSEETG